MGYMRHHAIVVTGYRRSAGSDSTGMLTIEEAHAEASAIFPRISEIIDSGINFYGSFLIPPDGSKEGWAESAGGDECRTRFRAWLRSKSYEDGSSPFQWAEIQYGDDERETIVTAHSDERPTPE